MSLRKRLLLTLAGIALLMSAPALWGITQHNRLRELVGVTRNRHASASLALGRLQARLAELDRLERAYIVTKDPALQPQVDAALTNARVHLANLGSAGYSDAATRVGLPLDSIMAETRRVVALMADGRAEEATALFERVKPLFAQADSALGTVAREIDERSAADLRRAGQISEAATATTLLALGGALLFTVLLGGWLTRTVFTPTSRLGHALRRVADGEHTVPPDLPYDRPDEIGDLARSFRWMTERLQELDRMKAEFVSITTHELKTPINVISGYAELMEERVLGELTEKQEGAVASIREQTRSLAQLVNELLDVSRLEAGGLTLDMNPVATHDLIASVQRAFDVLCRQKNLHFIVETAEDVPGTIPGDAARLRDQVLGNLLSNAVKFTPEDGEIRMRASRAQNGDLMVEVSDTGPGIPPDQRSHIFDKYYQIGEAARSAGAGLGLAIAHDVVKAHGGSIEVDSRVGAGTTFRLLLPSRRSAVDRNAAPDEIRIHD
jgi:signal transduction histidine kinase